MLRIGFSRRRLSTFESFRGLFPPLQEGRRRKYTISNLINKKKLALGHGGVPLSLDRMHLHLRILGEICGPLDDDDNGFGATVRFAPVVTKVRYRKKIK